MYRLSFARERRMSGTISADGAGDSDADGGDVGDCILNTLLMLMLMLNG